MFDFGPACDGMADLLGRIRDDQLDDPTPCDEYAVGALIDHVDLVVRGATALAAGDGNGLANADTELVHTGPGWRAVAEARLGALARAWEVSSAWTGSGNVPDSDLSNERWATIALTELVVHGWDLARATGQPFDLPEPTLQVCFDHVAEFVPNAPFPGLWGDPVAVPPDAPLLDRIVAITGRTPSSQRAAGG